MTPESYPIAEIFWSVQGEGVWTGTPMVFIRLAGCNVGRYASETKELPPAADGWTQEDLKLYQEKRHALCTTFDGQSFLCDTNYHSAFRASVDELMEEVGRYKHICLTGGEPFLHDLRPLVHRAVDSGVMVHIETSGTLPMHDLMQDFFDGATGPWITCSPKRGFQEKNYHYPREWKFPIATGQGVEAIEQFLRRNDPRPVFLQPINFVNAVDGNSVNYVLPLLAQHPTWRLSAQLHKYLEVR